MATRRSKFPVRGHWRRTPSGGKTWVEKHASTRESTYKLPYSKETYRQDREKLESNTRKTFVNIKDNASQIAGTITNILELTYTFSSGDIFSYIKNKGVSWSTNKICEEIEETNVYEKLAIEYNLNSFDISNLKRIIKKIIEKCIEFVADKVIKYIDEKATNYAIKQTISKEINNNIIEYISKTRTWTINETNYIPSHYIPRISAETKINIPKRIRETNKEQYKSTTNFSKLILYPVEEKDLKEILEKGISKQKSYYGFEEEKIEVFVLPNQSNTSLNEKLNKFIIENKKLFLVLNPSIKYEKDSKNKFKAKLNNDVNSLSIIGIIYTKSIFEDFDKFKKLVQDKQINTHKVTKLL